MAASILPETLRSLDVAAGVDEDQEAWCRPLAGHRLPMGTDLGATSDPDVAHRGARSFPFPRTVGPLRAAGPWDEMMYHVLASDRVTLGEK